MLKDYRFAPEMRKPGSFLQVLTALKDCGLKNDALLDTVYEEIAKHLGSPKAISRMVSYLRYVRPKTAELIVDEMLAIRSEIDTSADAAKRQPQEKTADAVSPVGSWQFEPYAAQMQA